MNMEKWQEWVKGKFGKNSGPPPFFVLQFLRRYAIISPRRGCSSSVERQLPKLHRWVRLPSAAPKKQLALQAVFCF